MNTQADLQIHRRWRGDPDLLAALRQVFTYGPGDNRATGYLYAAGEQDWPAPLAGAGPQLLAALRDLCGLDFTIVAFQAYRDGAGCDWHRDIAFGAQAVLSLGVTRTFGVRPNGGEPAWFRVEHGDLVVMPAEFQDGNEHCVPVEDAPGERCSIVFRTRREDG